MELHTEQQETRPRERSAARAARTTPARAAASAEHRATRFNWIVELDDRGDSRGAIELARWLHRDIGAEHHSFFGVHIPPEGGVDALQSEARAHAVVSSAEAEDIFTDIVRTEAASQPSEVLGELDPDMAAGLIVARRADAEGPSLIRLGGMVRRLAETTSTPIAIAPHDLELGQISHGPVLVAVEPGTTPSDAAWFAQHLARSKGLDLLLVNVAHVDDTGVLAQNADALADAYASAEASAASRLQGWAYEHGLVSAWRKVVRGDVRFAVQTMAQRYDASLMVCGTRQRSILQRLLEPSRALELARYARRPVILVPDSERAAAGDGDGAGVSAPFTWSRAFS